MARVVVIGSLNMDLVAVTPRLPLPGETVIGTEFIMECGGKGANQAYAAARLGGQVAMLGRVGKDDYGTRMRENLEKVGCDVSAVRAVEGSSGVATILVAKSGQNSIVVVSGANAHYLAPDLRIDAHHLDDARLALLQLETPMPTVLAAAVEAKKRGALVILDPAPAPGALPQALLSAVDVLTPNETEAVQLLERPVASLGDSDALEVAGALQSRGVETVILKLGGRGCLLAQRTTRVWIPAPLVKVVDTTAAGDVFNGALAVATAEGMSLEAACRFAVTAAALSVTRLGAQRSMPGREELAGPVDHPHRLN